MSRLRAIALSSLFGVGLVTAILFVASGASGVTPVGPISDADLWSITGRDCYCREVPGDMSCKGSDTCRTCYQSNGLALLNCQSPGWEYTQNARSSFDLSGGDNKVSDFSLEVHCWDWHECNNTLFENRQCSIEMDCSQMAAGWNCRRCTLGEPIYHEGELQHFETDWRCVACGT